jgi:hypothetical protein
VPVGDRPALNLDALSELAAAARKVGVPLDGHTVGMIGEAHAARIYGLTLMRASTAGFDAMTADGRTVEIKATTRSSVALRGGSRPPDLLVVVQLDHDTLQPAVRYFGPAAPVWEVAGRQQANGQRSVSIYLLDKLSRR